ncbi:MAG: zinc-dependent metalloprotease family protein [Planctomycetota bacterium]
MPHPSRVRHRRSALAVAACLVAGAAAAPEDRAGPASPLLGRAFDGLLDAPRLPGADPTVRARRPLAAWPGVLHRLRPGDRGRMDLGDGRVITIACDDRHPGTGDRLVWTGRIVHPGAGRFVLTPTAGGLAGALHLADGELLRVRVARDGRQVIDTVDPGTFPGCGAGAALTRDGRAEATAGAPGCDPATTIDVLAVYTPLAGAGAGGTEAIEAEIDLAVAATNAAFAASGLATRIRLVHVAEVEYDESGSYNDHAFRLRSPDDGFMDEVHEMRDAYRADLTTLLVADPDLCGTAFQLAEVTAGFEASAFSVVTWFCAVGNLSFAHELGHNMGAAHDRDNPFGAGPFPYSFGHRFVDDQERERRTIMALAPGERVGHFSNPDVWLDGTPTGVPPGDPDAAHNALTIDQTAPTIAGFRCSFDDCNGNGVRDVDDLAAGTSADCDGNGVPDECDVADADCDGNGVPDPCDLAAGTSEDADGNGVPDACEDCNGNGVPDGVDLATGTSEDCNGNDLPDACDLASGGSSDLDGDGRPDECAAVRNVTRDTVHATITLALAAAGDGDTITVAPGVYAEAIDFGGRAVRLVATAGPGQTVIDGSATATNVVRFAAGEGPGSVLRGFTVTGGSFVGGGGLLTLSASPTVADCVFEGNTSTLFGGGVATFDGSPLFINCLFVGNTTAGRGGGLFCQAGTPTVANGTFAGNSAAGGGGGVFATGGAVPWLRNCIVWDNPGGAVGEEGAMAAITFSDIEGGWSGDGFGNIDADPRFAAPAAGDFRPGAGSPCLDAGSNAGLPSDLADLDDDGDSGEPVPLDLAGRPRVVDDPSAPDTGDGAAPLVDMGAYERPACPADCARPADGGVDVTDLLALLAAWGQAGADCDVDGSGVVGVGDLLTVLAGWGACR